MNTILLPIAAFLISILLIVIYFRKKNTDNKETNIYSKMLVVNFVYSLLAILTFIYAKTMGNEFIVSLLQKIYMISMIALTVLIIFYNIAISNCDKRVEKLSKKGILISFLVISFFILITPLNVINYGDVLDGNGLSYDITLLAIILYLIIIIISSIYIFIKNKNIFSKDVPFVILIILYIIGLFVRSYFPSVMFENFFFSFILLIMYHTIENPDLAMITELNFARENADKANHAKTEFLSSMSHEIRTPLNAIVGFSNCIVTATTLEEAKENARDIVNASDTLLEIVNSILDISKIESGKIEIINSSYKAYDKFYDLASLMKNKMLEKGLDFQVNIAADLPTYLYGDYSSIKKVVTNLLSNAYKYTDKGFVKYEVNCVNKGDICRLIISVEDTGRGIKKENVNKLFTKFQRLDEDRNTTIEGTGLGLAITKQLVDMMGGEIILHTVYKEGSKFTVVLDQKIDFSSNLENYVSYDNYNKEFDLTEKKILIVDDNDLNLKVASKILTKYNADVVTMNNGFSCLDSIANNDYYDLILMDDMMPKMSGTETFNKLKNIKGFNIPVVCLTANAIEGMREKYLLEGFDDYLAKPINDKELRLVLTNIFNKSKDIKRVDFGELPSSMYEIGNNDNISVSQPIIYDDELIEIISDESDYYDTNIVETIYDDNYLKENDIDVSYAISLLGSMEMYNDTIRDFISEVEEKLDMIKYYKEIKDMPNYAILVHSLKSDSKYLGFMKLADISYQHELKSKDNDLEFVNSNFSLLENELNRVVSVATEYLKHI